MKPLAFYSNYRKDVISEGSDLYRLKQEYDKKPTMEAKRHGKTRSDV